MLSPLFVMLSSPVKLLPRIPCSLLHLDPGLMLSSSCPRREGERSDLCREAGLGANSTLLSHSSPRVAPWCPAAHCPGNCTPAPDSSDPRGTESPRRLTTEISLLHPVIKISFSATFLSHGHDDRAIFPPFLTHLKLSASEQCCRWGPGAALGQNERWRRGWSRGPLLHLPQLQRTPGFYLIPISHAVSQ